MARFILGSKPSVNIYFQRNGQGEPIAPVIDDPAVDIDSETKKTYKNYLVDATSQVNSFAISPETPSLSTEYGTSFQNILSQDTQQSEKSFAPNLESSVAPTNQNSPWFPSQFTTPDNLGNHYKDGKKQQRTLSAKTYIAEVDFPDTTRYIDNTLLKVHGYNESNKFIRQNILSTDNNPRNGPDYNQKLGSTGYQRLGLYSTSSHVGQQGRDTPENTKLSIQDMQKIGLNILFDAVQGDAGFDFKIQNESDFTEAEARAALPSPQRLGTKVSLSRFTAANTLKKITNDKYNQSGITNFYDNTNDVRTFGSYYSPYNQFDSLVSLGQIALAIALILAFIALLNLIGVISSAANKTSTPEEFISNTENGNTIDSYTTFSNVEKTRILGSSKIPTGTGGIYPNNNTTGGEFFSQWLGLNGIFSPTYHESGKCLQAGIQEFFGFSFASSGNPLVQTSAVQQFASTSLKVLIESGRLTTVLREIIRSGATVIEGGIADFSGGFSVVAIGNLLKKIRDLKIVKFINVLQSIGDKTLFEADIRSESLSNTTQRDGNGIAISGSNVSYIDSLPDTRKYYIAKSRLSDNAPNGNAGTLAWSTKTPGILSLPTLTGLRTIGLAEAIGSFSSGDLYGNVDFNSVFGTNGNPYGPEWGSNLTEAQNNYTNSEQKGRISSEVVRKYEEILEADYMPFYIHDLRTNEILPFHAFLEDVGDDFSVEYTSVEGYGRMDKVHIYKGTTRNVNVSFKMIATNEEDHAIMWYKINKLAMLIYPQWTQGRKIEVGELKFIQPFSQIPGATPVIRLRLGDMWKSNYSKMAVARLFGATTLEDYRVSGSINRVERLQQTEQRQQPTADQTSTSNTTNQSSQQSLPIRYIIIKYSNPLPGLPYFYNGNTENSIRICPGRNILLKAFLRLSREGIASVKILKAYRDIIGNQPLINGENVYFRRTEQSPEQAIAEPTINFRIGAERSRTDSLDYLGMLIDRNRTNALPENQPEQNTDQQQARQTANTSGESDMVITSEEANAQNQTSTMTSGMELMTAQDFYSQDRNPIIKSFRSSGGKGLAGVVTQFKIDTKGGTWGTDGSQGLRAPTMVTINLTMAVIHDITPGLDSNGVMNAPIWPVGNHSNFFVKNPRNEFTISPSRDQNTADINYFNQSQIRRR